MEVAAQDWPTLYEKNYMIYCEAFQKQFELQKSKENKQENYIFREQEYRHVIQELKN